MPEISPPPSPRPQSAAPDNNPSHGRDEEEAEVSSPLAPLVATATKTGPPEKSKIQKNANIKLRTSEIEGDDRPPERWRRKKWPRMTAPYPKVGTSKLGSDDEESSEEGDIEEVVEVKSKNSRKREIKSVEIIEDSDEEAPAKKKRQLKGSKAESTTGTKEKGRASAAKSTPIVVSDNDKSKSKAAQKRSRKSKPEVPDVVPVVPTSTKPPGSTITQPDNAGDTSRSRAPQSTADLVVDPRVARRIIGIWRPVSTISPAFAATTLISKADMLRMQAPRAQM